MYGVKSTERKLIDIGLPSSIRIGAHNVSTPENLLDRLSQIYQGSVGFDYGYLEQAEVTWLTEQIEKMQDIKASVSKQKRIAQLLIESEAWDAFMGKRFGQVKRYGLEGAESMLVAIDTLFQLSNTVHHAVIAMPHRGRLNLMTCLLGYPAEAVFNKLQGNSELSSDGSADVLSHLSYQGNIKLGGKEGLVTLLPNSSHLESINPIAQGFGYGLLKDLGSSSEVLPIQIHGDAAFNGQGVTMETLQMANLDGFSVGGTIHLTVNNQLGFTTPCYRGRSCSYSTDMAKLIKAPVFRVNANEPEDVARCAALAFNYRQRFEKDVFIDLIGYRRHGHNELDEPSFTQPTMYKTIKAMKGVASIYGEKLKHTGVINQNGLDSLDKVVKERLDAALKDSTDFKPIGSGIQDWKVDSAPATSEEILKQSLMASVAISDGFILHNRLAKFHVESRKAMLSSDQYDWATAEAMAIGSLLHSGISIRICGQDVGRGTFSHRHLQVYDQNTGDCTVPLKAMEAQGSSLEIVNSHLSEFAVAGFEYGLSIQNPGRLLPVWEAQFGDFFNGAQIIWDAYVSSGEQKWALQSGLVVLLPHGYDGAGPEHSSARIERWLQMCDEPVDGQYDHQTVNLQVVNPTTPATYFHLLRRQMARSFRKPLIVASPKTLLRLPAAVSSMNDLLGGFKPVIAEGSNESVETVVLTSGKFYYGLAKERDDRNLTSKLAIIRIEELSPFPIDQIKEAISKFKQAKSFVWCQEEPENMGAWSWMQPRLSKILPNLQYIGRPPSAAPAVGYSKLHKQQLQTIYDTLFLK